MKVINLLTVIAFAGIAFNTSYAQNDCIEQCLEVCFTIENGCLNSAYEGRSTCYNACAQNYPHWADHGYYGDACYDSCDMDLEQSVVDCIFSADLCIDACEQISDDCSCDNCRDGFTYNVASDQCSYTTPNGYDLVVFENSVFIRKNCDQPQNDCCPAGFQLAWEQACTRTYLSDECRDLIYEIEQDAALDEAQGDPVDWDRVKEDIAELENDPNCYVTEMEDECAYCYAEFIENLNIINVTIDGNTLILEPYCQ